MPATQPPPAPPFLRPLAPPWYGRGIHKGPRPMASTFASFQRGGVDFRVMTVQSIDMAAASNNSRVTVTYEILWRDFANAKLALIGYPQLRTAFTGEKYLKRNTPHSIEQGDGSFLHCTGICRTIGITPQEMGGSNEGTPFDTPYEYAHITAVYEALPYDILEDDEFEDLGYPDESTLSRYVEFAEAEATQKIAKGIGNSFVYCNAAGVPQDDKPVLIGRPFPYFEMNETLIWHQVPVVNAPIEKAYSLLNTVNLTRYWKWNPRQAMLAKVRRQRVTLVNGVRAFNLLYTFAINPKGWDMLPDPIRDGQYFKVVSRQDPTKILFEEAEHRDLFRVI